MSDFFKLSEHEHYLGLKNSLFISEEEFSQMLEKALGENSKIIANGLEKEPPKIGDFISVYAGLCGKILR